MIGTAPYVTRAEAKAAKKSAPECKPDSEKTPLASFAIFRVGH